MAREVESVHQFQYKPPYGMEKQNLVVRCDDGAIYEWEKPLDEPNWRFVHTIQPDGSFANLTRTVLPDAVEETASTLLGGWKK